MATADSDISAILDRFGVPFAGSVWRVQGTAVIYHKTLERIAAKAGVRWDAPTILRAERDEAVVLVTGRITPAQEGRSKAVERAEWSIGEALVGVNYRVSGKQAAYVFAMAEKRAKDRVILKLLDLHGLVYSEAEADEFGQSARRGRGVSDEEEPQDGPDGPYEDTGRAIAAEHVAECLRKVEAYTDRGALLTWWNGAERKRLFQDFGLNRDEATSVAVKVTARSDVLKGQTDRIER